MKPISGKSFARLVEQSGWRLLRIKGSHHIYGKPNSQVRLSIPIHKNQMLKIGLQQHLMKLANIREDEV